MSVRPELKEGLYNIECAICDGHMKSNEVIIGKESGLPMHAYHAEENQERFPIDVPTQKVPDPQNQPDDLFKSFDVDVTPTPITY